MKIAAIVAASRNRVIGKGNEIPWYLQADFKFFKKTTLNHHIIMGRKTFESIGRPLPKRTNIVITRNPFFVASNVIVVNSLEAAFEIAESNGENTAFVIGGGTIYEQSLPYLDEVYYTEVDTIIEKGDAFFPELDKKEWNFSEILSHKKDDKNDYNFTVSQFERKKQKTTH